MSKSPKRLTKKQIEDLAERGFYFDSDRPGTEYTIAWNYHLGRWESSYAHVDKALREVQCDRP